MKYQERISQSQDQKNVQELSFKVEEAQHQLAADELATKKSLVQSKAQLEAAKACVPFDTQSVISLQLKVESLEDGLKRISALKEELF